MDHISIPQLLWQEILGHLQACYPEEGCGMLSGRDGIVTAVYPITNELHSTTRFRFAPREQASIFMEIMSQSDDLLAIFHSHPHSAPYPSVTDRAEHAYPEACALIVSLSDSVPQWGGYMISGGEVTSIDILIL